MRHRRPAHPEAPTVPTKPTKALVALVVTLAGLVGIHLTNGTAQLVIMVAQLVIVVYGVWRARNDPKDGPGVGEFL
jgi:hypothetical protein